MRPSATMLPGENTSLDPSELRFRADSVPAGVWITEIICVPGLLYALLWEHEHATALAIIMAAAALGGLIVLALPWPRILQSSWREIVFGAWSGIDLALIVALAALDGGGDSVFVALFVIPIVFAGLSYPRRLVLGVSAAAVLGYVAVAAASATPAGYALMYAATIGSTAAMSTWQARNHERRRELLAIASRTDPLTGALNRRGFQRAAAQMLASVVRLEHPASLVLLDLDDFKGYNDAYGHAAGDDLLCWAVRRIEAALRATDALARLGGDEFAILLAGAERPAAEAVVDRVREELAERVDTSWGLACAPEDGTDLDALYRSADAALYEAKGARAAPVTGVA